MPEAIDRPDPESFPKIETATKNPAACETKKNKLHEKRRAEINRL
jgi:hypothetical protein